jgi:hypothetical protein
MSPQLVHPKVDMRIYHVWNLPVGCLVGQVGCSVSVLVNSPVGYSKGTLIGRVFNRYRDPQGTGDVTTTRSFES